MNQAVENVRRAKGYTEDVEFSPMDATRTEPDYLFAMLTAVIEAGATTINIPDTVGYTIPEEFGKLIASIRDQVRGADKVRISVHCHNDLGMAVANSLAAVKNGARQVEGCINGIGERAGNAALEEVIMALETRRDFMGVSTNIDTNQIYRSSRMVSDITGFAVQPNKAIVGANAFRHASGIHQDGVIKERTTYEIMDPQAVGLPSNMLVLGKLSGRAGLRSRLEELGYQLSKEQLDQVFERFKALADKKREVTDRDLDLLMREEHRAITESEPYKLEHIQFISSTSDIPTATVRIVDPNGNSISEAATGNGPRGCCVQRDKQGCERAQPALGLPGSSRIGGDGRGRRGYGQDREQRGGVGGQGLRHGYPAGQREGLYERPEQAHCHGWGPARRACGNTLRPSRKGFQRREPLWMLQPLSQGFPSN